MPPGIVFFGAWFLIMLGSYVLLHFLYKRFTGSDASLGDTYMNYTRNYGDYHWQQLNQRQPGEAEKPFDAEAITPAEQRRAPARASLTDGELVDIARLQDRPAQDERTSLQDLLPDDGQAKTKRN